MILNNRAQSTIVASEGVGAVTAVNIANTPHMFSLLSSGLYSDKIAAVLREVGCNAMDAHIMSNKADKPIQVKLPSSLDRTFYIKDWGPGLDDREFRECYTTYGWSNKQAHEDATGAFGLGSKSPFAYTLQNRDEADGYTVEAVKNGVRRVYTVYLGPTGGPQVALLGEFPADSDWPTGVKVSFPVQDRDIAEFHEKAQKVFRWFKVKPEILGLNGSLQDVDFKTREDFFGIAENQPAGVVSGNVWYPLRVERLRDLNEVEALFARNITLFLPLGTVMMTPAREELEYNELTRQNVKAYLTKAALKVAQEIRDAVMVQASSRWEWYQSILAYHDSLPFYLRNNLGAVLKYAGVSDEDVEQINSAVASKVKQLPGWFGTVNPASSKFESPVTLNCTAAKYAVSGDRVVKRRIAFGHTNERMKSTEGRGEYVKATVSYLRPPLMVYTDGPLADMRARAYVNATNHPVILVSPLDKKDLGAAKTYLEALVSTSDFDGLKIQPSSSLPMPEDYEERKRIARENKKKAPRALVAKELVSYLDLATGKVQEGLFADVGPEDNFYLETQFNRSEYRRTLFNQKDGFALTVATDWNEKVFASLAVVVKQLFPRLTRVLIVGRPGDKRRLKLEALEMEPLGFALRDALKASEKVRKVLMVRSTHAQDYFKDGGGTLGLLLRASDPENSVHAFWQAMSKHKNLGPLMMDVLKEKSLHFELSADDKALQNSMQWFKGLVQSMGADRDGMLMNGYELASSFSSKYHFLSSFQNNTIERFAETNPEKMAAMLSDMLSLTKEHQERTQAKRQAAEAARKEQQEASHDEPSSEEPGESFISVDDVDEMAYD